MLRVDHVRHGDHHGGVERAVRVLEARVDGVEAVRFVLQELAFRLPAHEVVQGLEDSRVDLELAVLELLVDFLVEHVGEAARDRDLDAGITLLEDFRLRLPRRGRPADIEHEGTLGFGLGIKLRLGADG